jgi:hypothetical protein
MATQPKKHRSVDKKKLRLFDRIQLEDGRKPTAGQYAKEAPKAVFSQAERFSEAVLAIAVKYA